MEERKLKITDNFKEELRKRIVGIWWIICFAFLISLGLFGWFGRKNYRRNFSVFAIVLVAILSVLATLTAYFYVSRKKKYQGILNLLDQEDLEMNEKLYNLALKYGHKNMAILTKEGLALIRGFFMFQMLAREKLIWIYQQQTEEVFGVERVPAMQIITNTSQMYTLRGYRVTNFLKKLYPNIYLSVEGSLRHRELQNNFAMDFAKMAEATGNYSRLPARINENPEQKKYAETGKIIEKKRKAARLRKRLRIVLIILFQIGVILCLIGLALWLLAKNPTTGKGALQVKIGTGAVFFLFVVSLTVNFFIHILHRKFWNNFVYFIVLVLIFYAIKVNHLYNSLMDLTQDGSKKRFFSITRVGYRNEFWIPLNSEYQIYTVPVGSRSQDEDTVYTIKKAELLNTERIDEIISREDTSKALYLGLELYSHSGVIKKAEILDREAYEEAMENLAPPLSGGISGKKPEKTGEADIKPEQPAEQERATTQEEVRDVKTPGENPATAEERAVSGKHEEKTGAAVAADPADPQKQENVAVSAGDGTEENKQDENTGNTETEAGPASENVQTESVNP